MYYNTKASGARIRELRLAKKLDQIELAELLNVSHGYISRIESGKKGCSVDLLIQLSEIFGTSLDYLILGKCHDVLDAHHLKENIQHLIEDLEHFQSEVIGRVPIGVSDVPNGTFHSECRFLKIESQRKLTVP